MVVAVKAHLKKGREVMKMAKREITQFGIEVKKKLIEKRMTQFQLSQKIGTSNIYLTDMMYGKHPLLKSEVVKKVLEELELDKNLISNEESI